MNFGICSQWRGAIYGKTFARLREALERVRSIWPYGFELCLNPVSRVLASDRLSLLDQSFLDPTIHVI